MAEFAAASDASPAGSRARSALFKRLADVVCLPGSRVNAFERAVTADLLVEMLREAAPEERLRVARRLCSLAEIPPVLARLLLRDRSDIAAVLLEQCPALADTDLIDCARTAGPEHRRLIAGRRGLHEVVSEVLAEAGDPAAIETLLRNGEARLSPAAVELIVAASRSAPQYVAPLLKRAELRPNHAYVMFWWAEPDCRRLILQRFAVSREVLQDAAGDIFQIMAEEGWQDALARKALQFIERRQRNRAAIAKSPYESLDDAVAAAAKGGMTRDTAEEISYLAGLKPMTGAKIFTDPGGEPLAILCKATGLPKASLRQLWRALRRPEADAEGRMVEGLERVMTTYDMIAVDRAQTVLRYWNWSLSSALTPALIDAIRSGETQGMDEYSVPQKAAILALSREFSR